MERGCGDGAARWSVNRKGKGRSAEEWAAAAYCRKAALDVGFTSNHTKAQRDGAIFLMYMLSTAGHQRHHTEMTKVRSQ